MLVVPAVNAVTKPVLDTVATAVFEDTQGLEAAGDTLALKLTTDPTQIEEEPVITGKLFTVTVIDFTHPLLSV
jgi:hypothetical protein